MLAYTLKLVVTHVKCIMSSTNTNSKEGASPIDNNKTCKSFQHSNFGGKYYCPIIFIGVVTIYTREATATLLTAIVLLFVDENPLDF